MATARRRSVGVSSGTTVLFSSVAGSLAALVVLTLAVCLGGAGTATAAEEEGQSGLTWTATIDDRQVGRISDADPLELGAKEPTVVRLQLTNGGDAPIVVNSLRLEGRVLGLAFFTYSVRLALELAPGESVERGVDLYLDDITDQADGLIPARFALLDEDRNTLASEDFPADVQGSLWSTYGWFGLAVAASTALLIGALLLAVARTGQPGRVGLADNRWLRGLQFAVPGLGVGLTVTFTLSVAGLLLPSLGAWLPIVAVCTGGAFVLGYFLPTGRAADERVSASAESEAAIGGRVP